MKTKYSMKQFKFSSSKPGASIQSRLSSGSLSDLLISSSIKTGHFYTLFAPASQKPLNDLSNQFINIIKS